MALQQLPLSLYIHIPWCVEKCPYCDFNSHALKTELPEADYVAALLNDLEQDIKRFNIDRELHSIFIGGGTPSLFSPLAIETLLTGVYQLLKPSKNIEVTLEANPGTVEAEKFIGFSNAGVNRLSIGVQSFADDKLIQLGRIHNTNQAETAAKLAAECGVSSFNLDLMHGLPKQNLSQALTDLDKAIALNPQHISWYQLTIEPNTSFYSKPPVLPDDDILWDIQQQGVAKLAAAGYVQYETSAYAKKGFESNHNKNYWRFGDYLGIGCGAHGKITDTDSKHITRTVKVKHPKGYLDESRAFLDQEIKVSNEELPFEFMMNQLRLLERFSLTQFTQRTGLSVDTILPHLNKAKQQQLMTEKNGYWQVTPHGQRYLNDVLALFI